MLLVDLAERYIMYQILLLRCVFIMCKFIVCSYSTYNFPLKILKGYVAVYNIAKFRSVTKDTKATV